MSFAACEELRQIAHLGGDHRKASARFTGARRLDSSIQRKQIGLARDLVDDRDDVGNFARLFLDPRHGRHGLRNHLTAAVGCVTRRSDNIVGMPRILGVFLHRDGYLFHRRRGLLEARDLLPGPLRQVHGA